MAHDASPEHLLDVFRTAALSVTTLYKSSLDAQKKARAEGFQDCLDDLLQFLDKEHLGLNDGEGWKIRAWANERLDNRDVSPQLEVAESDYDSEKQDAVSSPDIHRSNSTTSLPRPLEPPAQQPVYTQTMAASKTPSADDIAVDEPEIVVPSRNTFDFQTSINYPQDAQNNLNLASLHLSDNNRPYEHATSHSSTTPTSRRRRPGVRGVRRGTAHTAHIGPRTGSKRLPDFGEFFDFANVKEFGPPSKRSRHM